MQLHRSDVGDWAHLHHRDLRVSPALALARRDPEVDFVDANFERVQKVVEKGRV